MDPVKNILQKPQLSRADIVFLLGLQGRGKEILFEQAANTREVHTGNRVYFRGLIEFSNLCGKNCLYCGIRHDNESVRRYNLKPDEIFNAARFADENGYGSLVLQSGEDQTPHFSQYVEKLLTGIHKVTGGRLRITLSCGEQDGEVYKRWFEHGAHRYLLRIETSNAELYQKLHPCDDHHQFQRRTECLSNLQKTGYQVGTGVMIGLPFQTMDDLAGDLLFMEKFRIDMVGMGPYLEHEKTPLYAFRNLLLPKEERFQLTLKMIAVLRVMMKDINIAATTALQVIDPLGREKAIRIGANVIMPNITPGNYRNDYLLYQNKPCTDENASDCKTCLETRIALTKNEIVYGEWGDSAYFTRRIVKEL